MATGILPREIAFETNLSRGKIPVAKPRFLLHKNKNKKHRHSIRRGLVFSYGACAIVYSSLASLLWLIHRDSRNLRELTRRRP